VVLTGLPARVCRSKRILIAGFAAAVSLLVVSAAIGITNGQPDGDGHRYVGMLAVDFGDGNRYELCSGSYAGERKGDPKTGVFLTAGHCLAAMSDLGVSADQLYVTFDSDATYNWDVGVVDPAAHTWYRAREFDLDPGFVPFQDGVHDFENHRDYGVVLLESKVRKVGRVELPRPGLLDRLVARGRPVGQLFVNVGYGIDGSFAPPPGRMRSVSVFDKLTPSWLELRMDPSLLAGHNGGHCLFDSGGPKLVPGTDIVVAVTSDADDSCAEWGSAQRLDVPDAQAFLGRYLPLPS
jgi:hypothetical protein